MDRGGESYFYHPDGLGSITQITDSSKQPAASYGYDAFGNITSQTGSLTNPYTYTGREYDPESGLYYYRARYYDPKIGRFLSEDPIGFLGRNSYAYVGNKPTRASDPWGLWGEDVHSGIGNPEYGTYKWAKELGFSDLQAQIIAISNNSTDQYANWAVIVGVPGRHFDTAVSPVDSRDLFAKYDLHLAIKLYSKERYAELFNIWEGGYIVFKIR